MLSQQHNAPVAENPAAGQSNTVPSQEDTLVAVETESDTSEMPAEPREIKLLIPEKTFRKIPESDCLSVTYDDIDLLKILNMEPVPADAPDHFPEWLRQLDGKRIRLRGFMFPAFVPTGIKTFGFARDNGICCFVKQPKVYDMIEVRMAEGKTTDYIDGRPFDVEGTFRIDPYGLSVSRVTDEPVSAGSFFRNDMSVHKCKITLVHRPIAKLFGEP